jgi:putative endonuclease
LVDTRQRGRYWERAAESFLQKRGLKTLQRNFQARFGEIDLVMLDGETLVFTEVRYRANQRHGSGADSVTPRKQQRIIRAARLFLQYHDPQQTRPCRFDVISIGRSGGRTVFDWVRDAFDSGQG